jgi:hypothetical protein
MQPVIPQAGKPTRLCRLRAAFRRISSHPRNPKVFQQSIRPLRKPRSMPRFQRNLAVIARPQQRKELLRNRSLKSKRRRQLKQQRPNLFPHRLDLFQKTIQQGTNIPQFLLVRNRLRRLDRKSKLRRSFPSPLRPSRRKMRTVKRRIDLHTPQNPRIPIQVRSHAAGFTSIALRVTRRVVSCSTRDRPSSSTNPQHPTLDADFRPQRQQGCITTRTILVRNIAKALQ